MERFAAIDFETANGQRSSVCSVGIVLVENGEITDSIYSLIRPVPISIPGGQPLSMDYRRLTLLMLMIFRLFGKVLLRN